MLQRAAGPPTRGEWVAARNAVAVNDGTTANEEDQMERLTSADDFGLFPARPPAEGEGRAPAAPRKAARPRRPSSGRKTKAKAKRGAKSTRTSAKRGAAKKSKRKTAKAKRRR
jgi:hypothetical protein